MAWCTSMVNLVVRSTSVPIADRLNPMIRSPSCALTRDGSKGEVCCSPGRSGYAISVTTANIAGTDSTVVMKIESRATIIA